MTTRSSIRFAISVLLVLAFIKPVFAGFIFQNFEPDNGSPIVTNSVDTSLISIVDRTEGVHLGQAALKYESPVYWAGFGVESQVASVVDLEQNNNDRITFWTLAFPHRNCYVFGCEKGTDNTVGVKFFDNGNYQNGYEVWTTIKAKYNQWTKLWILFSQLPPDFDLNHVTRIEFKNFWPGKYYFDDIHAVREDRVYQAFNQEEFKPYPNETEFNTDFYGWKWNDNDTIYLSTGSEPVKEGEHSWKMVLNGYWGGGGIKSQQETYHDDGQGNVGQSFWNSNFLPEQNDRLSFWIYALAENGMDNNLSVQFYDHGLHATDQTKAEVWVKQMAVYGQWTRIEVLFSQLPATFNLHDVDKIQFQQYWPGTFYIDDIRITGPHPVIKEALLSQGIVQWNAIAGATNYRLQQSDEGTDGSWKTIYSGPLTTFNITEINKKFLRVRSEESFVDNNSLPYSSPWSDTAVYTPALVFFKYPSLANGLLDWTTIPQATLYEIQSAPDITGPWTQIYKGIKTQSPLAATGNTWYRVRAIKEVGGVLSDFTDWSRPQVYRIVPKFVKAAGTVLKDNDGIGNELVLSGVNLGNVLLTEDWMTGFGIADNPPIVDDWTLRNVLTSRFGVANAEALLKSFQNNYVNDYDFDRLAESKVTLVRLPIYYRNIMDDNGNFIKNAQNQIDFSQIDRIVDAMASRGIYILLDLHGAPGAQSGEFHTGRKNFNKLFEASPEGETYRTQTESFWREMAKHYKNNPWVVGYDLLNEPFGAPTPQVLADLYDRLYDVIRAEDANHLIVMEGIWDWDTLPSPAAYNWQNVMYEFHYYCPRIPEPQDQDDPVPVLGQTCADYGSPAFRLSFQEAFIQSKITTSLQNTYNVPALIGEFSAYEHKSVWELYTQTFNAQKWSWTSWSYKDRSSPSTWGVLNHAKYDETFPKFRALQADNSPGDSYADLTRKLSKYTTTDYHIPNVTLQNVLKDNAIYPVYSTLKPEIFETSPKFLTSPLTFGIHGRNFGGAQGSSTVNFNGSPLSVIHWSDTEIEVFFPTNQSAGARQVTVTTPQGTSNIADVIVLEPTSVPNGGLNIQQDGSFLFIGQGMCDTPGMVEFYPTFCNDLPPGSIACNKGDAAIKFWSENLIMGYVPPDYSPGSFGGANVKCSYSGDLYPTMLGGNNAPVLSPIGHKTVTEGQTLQFDISATDADGDAITYSALNLPSGATFVGQTFTWTPQYNQSGLYNVTFKASDLPSSDQETITISVNNVPFPDLTLTFLSSLSAAVAPTDNFSIIYTAANQGDADALNVVTDFHLSLDNSYGTGNDIVLSTHTLSFLNAATSKTRTISLTAPSNASGNYYLCAKVDYTNAITESNKTNQTLCTATPIFIGYPDLIMTAVSAPALASTGAIINVNATVANPTLTPVDSFNVGIYLSTDAAITTTDFKIAKIAIDALGANASKSNLVAAEIPKTFAAGIYYIGAIADFTERRQESNENNNSLKGNAVNITPGGDLVVTQLSAPASALRGAQVTVTYTVKNQGTGEVGGSPVGIYLSTDTAITTADRRMDADSVPALDAGEMKSNSFKIRIPANVVPGTYYWGAIADYKDNRLESNESNNAFTSNSILIQ